MSHAACHRVESSEVGKAVDQPLTEATRLGSYEIVRKLARGGMAELYLARSVGPEGFEKVVVLKKILPNYAQNPKFVKLFLDEAKIAAGLDHPHIAQVYDFGRINGIYYIAMELVQGFDLRKLLRHANRTNEPIPLPVIPVEEPRWYEDRRIQVTSALGVVTVLVVAILWARSRVDSQLPDRDIGTVMRR